MLTKKTRVLVTIGLGVLIDLLVSLVMNLITDCEWVNIVYSYPIIGVILLFVIYGGTWRYVKNL